MLIVLNSCLLFSLAQAASSIIQKSDSHIQTLPSTAEFGTCDLLSIPFLTAQMWYAGMRPEPYWDSVSCCRPYSALPEKALHTALPETALHIQPCLKRPYTALHVQPCLKRLGWTSLSCTHRVDCGTSNACRHRMPTWMEACWICIQALRTLENSRSQTFKPNAKKRCPPPPLPPPNSFERPASCLHCRNSFCSSLPMYKVIVVHKQLESAALL